MDKKKLSTILMICGLVALIVVVIVTSIILNQKNIKRDELKKKNEDLEKQLPKETEARDKIFLKNVVISIDKQSDF